MEENDKKYVAENVEDLWKVIKWTLIQLPQMLLKKLKFKGLFVSTENIFPENIFPDFSYLVRLRCRKKFSHQKCFKVVD